MRACETQQWLHWRAWWRPEPLMTTLCWRLLWQEREPWSRLSSGRRSMLSCSLRPLGEASPERKKHLEKHQLLSRVRLS